MIPLQNPFLYNPQDGNLLLDVRIPNCVNLNPGAPINFDFTGNFPAIVSLVFSDDVNMDEATTNQGFGLVTQFQLSPPPPPTTPIATNIPTISEWGLIATAGLLGFVGFMVIRRRKVSA